MDILFRYRLPHSMSEGLRHLFHFDVLGNSVCGASRSSGDFGVAAVNCVQAVELFYFIRRDALTHLPYLIYGLAGCFTLCASELFENIQRIANYLSRMEIKKDK